MRLRAFSILVCTLVLSGCGDQLSGRYGAGSQFGANGQSLLGPGSAYRSPVPPSGQRIAILLPLSGPRQDLGKVLLQAAQLALPSGSSPILDAIDTGGTPAGAATAAQAAIGNGDALILGPLTSAETASVAPIAKASSTPVMAFTNDSLQSQPGVWTLGISPDQQIRRLLIAAQAQGKTQFAALLPSTDFGRAMAHGLSVATEAENLPAATIRMHGPGMASITASARDLADYANRRGPIDAKVKAARALGTPDGRREAQELVKTPIPPPPFDVLLLADTGDELQEIAAVLPYYDIDRNLVQVIGPALWADPATGSGAVLGAWYAAPDNNTRSTLEQNYIAKYGAAPSPLADLAFDGASIAAMVVSRGPADVALLTQPAGFAGADGPIAFLPDGSVRRGLGVFRIERGGPSLVDPAPQTATAPGF